MKNLKTDTLSPNLNMKNLAITFFALTMSLSSCKKDPTVVKGFYDSMHYVTSGGGQIDFTLYKTKNPDQLRAIVSKVRYRDTTLQFMLDKNPNDAAAFLAFKKAVNNEAQLNGGFKPSTLPTGSWSYIYFTASTGEVTEVTNEELKNSLIEFGQIVQDKLK